jgi:hypothetical protein
VDLRAGIKVERNMNHDMIAAGHPRLNFEFATYQRALPPHWKEKDRRTGRARGADFETRAWGAGQIASTRAALDLLLTRLPGGEQDQERTPWPEFSEFNCYDCHHDLKLSGRPTTSAGQKRGSPGWYRSWELERLSEGAPGGLPAATITFLDLMKKPLPSAEKLRQVLPLVGSDLKVPPSKPEALLRWVRPTDRQLKQMNLDQACWLYHALIAIEISRRQGPGPVPDEEEIDRQFGHLAHKLLLPVKVGDTQFNSPRDYNPADVQPLFTGLMDRLAGLLGNRPKERR